MEIFVFTVATEVFFEYFQRFRATLAPFYTWLAERNNGTYAFFANKRFSF